MNFSLIKQTESGYHNIKSLYYYKDIYIYNPQLYMDPVERITLIILFNDFLTQSFSYVNEEEMFSCIEIKHRKITYELDNKVLINMLIGNKIQRQLFYNLWKNSIYLD